MSGRAAAAAQQINDYHDESNDQYQVNQTTGHVQAETQDPQNQQYPNNRPKHIDLLGSSFLFCIFRLRWNGAERLPALQTKSLGSRGD
jgi:hypothetical protein